MRPGFGPLQVVLRAAHDHLMAVIDVVLQHLLEIERLRTAIDNGQHHDPVSGLQHAMAIELVEHDFSLGFPLALKYDAQPFAARFVANIGKSVDGFVAHQIGYFL